MQSTSFRPHRPSGRIILPVAAITLCCLLSTGGPAGVASAAPAPGVPNPPVAPIVPISPALPAAPIAPIVPVLPIPVAAPTASTPVASVSLNSPNEWSGTVAVDGAHVRATPSMSGAVVTDMAAGQAVQVSEWVVGDQPTPDNPTWAKIGDGQYIHSSLLRPAIVDIPAPPADASGETGRWIDLNLTQQVAVAYEGSTPVHMARVSTGRAGWETPAGVYHIQRRVADETMASSTLASDESSQASYHLDHVRWTQYFSADGKALHENYWKPADQIGIPSSHGCAGMVAADAQFFWDFAAVGTPIYAHN